MRRDPHLELVWWWYYRGELLVLDRAGRQLWNAYHGTPPETPERVALWVELALGV